MTMDRRTGSGIRIIARPAKLAGLLVLFGTLVSVIGGVGGASAADNSQPHRSKGSVTIVVKGLPKHTRSNVIMVGPRGRSQKPLRRELDVLEKKTLKRLPIGRYKLIVKKATVKRDFQTTRAGATVLPIHRMTNVKVRSGKRAKAVVVYGTIVNPGLKRITGSPLTVTGNPAHPTAIVLPGRIRFPKNAILAMPPSSVAPYGVLSHVVSRHLLANRTKVRVRPATIYEALPNAVFASPLKLTPTSSSESRKAVSGDILDGVGCGDTGWVKPAVSISNAKATGAWATTEIGLHTAFGFVGHEFTTGLEINFGFTLGASIEAELKDPSCSITAGGFQFTAVAAGLPITGGFSPNMSVSTANELKLKMGMKMPVTMRFRGGIDVELKPEIPVYLEPDLSVGEVELEGPELDKSLNPWPIEAGVGIGLNFGIGAAIGGSPDLQASVTGNMDSGFVASLSAERCGLDAELGSFYAAGRLGPAEIRTPSTPPLLHKELVDYPKALCGWGENGPTGETGPTGLTGPTGPTGPKEGGFFKSVSTGDGQACGLKMDDTIACWGYVEPFRETPPEGSFKSVESGGRHVCAIRPDDAVTCWDYGEFGQTSPPEGRFRSISGGSYHTCGIKMSGVVACWGQNDGGKASPPGGIFKSVSAGDKHTCGVRADDTIACWGRNYYGAATPPDGAFASVDASFDYTCGLRLDASITCWGRLEPFGPDNETLVPPDVRLKSVSLSSRHGCGIQLDYTLICWGYNGLGQASPPSGKFRNISSGDTYSCGIRIDDRVVCWGFDDNATPPPT